AFLIFALTGGGRIVGSDEVTMFQLAHAMLEGHIDVPQGATLQGPDGRYYSKNTAGQAVLSLPLVAAGSFAARAAGFRKERAVLAGRFGASFFNAFMAAALLGVFYLFARRLGVGARAGLAATAMLGFTTPLWVYAKSFMAEPTEALGLLLTLGGAALGSAGREQTLPGERRWLWVAALGAFLAISAKASMLPLALLALTALGVSRVSRYAIPALGVAVAVVGHLIYNAARFGTPFESGYGAQASVAAFSTPLWVGVYGLLLSSGKGLAWFAPAAWLAPLGWAAMRRARAHSDEPHNGAAHAAARAGLAVFVVALAQFGSFQHWGGDGSWGPRYLVPLLPLLLLAVAFALEGASRARRRIAWGLAIAGLLVQLGGVGIYFGAQMRVAGDYPYTLALENPHFMEASHFDPRFTPIVGHWRMLIDNGAAHLRGDAPVLAGGGVVDPRLGIPPGDSQALLRAIDLWWCYASYAGIPRAPLVLAVVALLVASLWAAAKAVRSAEEENSA
ncbi:MAG: hypothetical protein ABIR01_07180, partial [Candidatus Eisenbacteria bacterium]